MFIGPLQEIWDSIPNVEPGYDEDERTISDYLKEIKQILESENAEVLT